MRKQYLVEYPFWLTKLAISLALLLIVYFLAVFSVERFFVAGVLAVFLFFVFSTGAGSLDMFLSATVQETMSKMNAVNSSRKPLFFIGSLFAQNKKRLMNQAIKNRDIKH